MPRVQPGTGRLRLWLRSRHFESRHMKMITDGWSRWFRRVGLPLGSESTFQVVPSAWHCKLGTAYSAYEFYIWFILLRLLMIYLWLLMDEFHVFSSKLLMIYLWFTTYDLLMMIYLWSSANQVVIICNYLFQIITNNDKQGVNYSDYLFHYL